MTSARTSTTASLSSIHRRRVPDRLLAAATNDRGTKFIAFLLALIVFIVTRDEVQRSFTVPLRVLQDPDRLLLTDVPSSVEVRLRGPWTKVNRIGADSLGAAVLDLREARPGPMELDPATIVMPAGVVLDALSYDPIDLRFDPIVERRVPIRAVIEGAVGSNYTLDDHDLQPDHWTLRGPESQLVGVAELVTEPIDLGGAKRDIDMQVVIRLPADVADKADPGHPLVFVGSTGDPPTVRFTADVEAELGEISVEVETSAALRAALPGVPEAELPLRETVTIRGPLHILDQIDDLASPLEPVVEVEPAGRDQRLRAKLRFTWTADVPLTGRDALAISPPLVILSFAVGEGAG